MSTMQQFYNQLFHAGEVQDPNLARLAQLTQINLAQARLLKADQSWDSWPPATA